MNPDTNQFEKLKPELQEMLAGNGVTGLNRKERRAQSLRDKKRQKKNGGMLNPPTLLRPNGEPVPKHWSVFTIGENVVVNNYTFKIAYIGESALLLEPVGLVMEKGTEK